MHNVSHLLNTGCCGFIKGLKLLFSDVTNLDQKLFFFFSIQKKQHNPNFMSEFPFFYLCFRCASLPVCISSVSYLVFFLSFFFIAPQMELSFYLEITKTTFKKRLSEPVQQSGAFWKSYARTRAHLSEEGSIKCSKLLWSKISEQSCWTEVAVYLSWPWQTPARFTIQ